MNVKEILKTTIAAAGQTKKAATPTEAGAFGKLLQEATRVSEKGKAVPAACTQAVDPLQGGPVALTSLNLILGAGGPEQVRIQGMKAAEGTLRLLEEYQKTLADPRTSLKKIDSLVQTLSQKAQDLSRISEGLPASDPLRKIVADVGVLCAVEAERFNRGEYV
jgi:hypothetical protein